MKLSPELRERLIERTEKAFATTREIVDLIERVLSEEEDKPSLRVPEKIFLNVTTTKATYILTTIGAKMLEDKINEILIYLKEKESRDNPTL